MAAKKGGIGAHAVGQKRLKNVHQLLCVVHRRHVREGQPIAAFGRVHGRHALQPGHPRGKVPCACVVAQVAAFARARHGGQAPAVGGGGRGHLRGGKGGGKSKVERRAARQMTVARLTARAWRRRRLLLNVAGKTRGVGVTARGARVGQRAQVPLACVQRGVACVAQNVRDRVALQLQRQCHRLDGDDAVAR